jgi:hypothetical protein
MELESKLFKKALTGAAIIHCDTTTNGRKFSQ